MDNLRKNELEELKKFFVEDGWVDGLFQMLFFLEDVKVGMYLQEERRRRKLKRLRNMLYWFEGIYVSMRHGGYATKNKELYKQWNKFFRFERDAEKFLGYPSCCVRAHIIMTGSVKNSVYLYSIIKAIKEGRKPIQDLQQILSSVMFLHHYPCRIDCARSNELAEKYAQVIIKYNWLVADLLPDYKKHKIKVEIIDLQALSNLPTLVQDQLRNPNIVSLWGFNPIDVTEILENNMAFKETIAYGKQLLESFL